MLVAWIIPGISVTGWLSALIAAIIIALINAFIKPLIEMISLPINFLTFGLFSLVINALLLMLAGAITPGLSVEGFWSAFFGAILLAIFAYPVGKI